MPAKLPSTFNSTQYEDMNDFSPIPKSTVIAQIVEVGWKDSKSTPGNKFIQCDWRVIQGEYVNRMFFTRLNLINANAQALEIANKELATMCRACGKVSVEDVAELQGLPCEVDLDIKPKQGENPPSQVIRMYRAVGKGVTVTATKESTSSGEPARKAPPWQQEEEAEEEEVATVDQSKTKVTEDDDDIPWPENEDDD